MGSGSTVGVASSERALGNLREHIGDWHEFLEACRTPLPACVWAHPERISPSELAEMLTSMMFAPAPVAWASDVFRIGTDDKIGFSFPYLAGLLHVQEEVSILAADVLGAAPGERVLDVAAAPGGKAARIALRTMNNTGSLVANDRNPGRLRALRGNLDRLGVVNASVTCYDATGYPDAAGTFDHVIVDAPCSCTGTIRKNPRALADADPESLVRLSGLQRAILRRAAAICRAGGSILYTTCSFAPEENEAVVDAVIREHDERLSLESIDLSGVVHSPGLNSWGGATFDASLERCIRIYPHQNDTGGFFLARLRKHD